MSRVGTKRSDRRWRGPNGTIWASKFEWVVYDRLQLSGVDVRKCDERDTLRYTEPKRNLRCLACGSDDCVQDRTYTADLYVVPAGAGGIGNGYYLETKGYFPAAKRNLFRHLRAAHPRLDIRVALEANHWVTKGKTRLTDYFSRYLKTTPVHVWDGDLPEDWK